MLPLGFLYLYKGQECAAKLPEETADDYEMLPVRKSYDSWVPWPQRKDYDGAKGDLPRIVLWNWSPVFEQTNNTELRYDGCRRPCYVTYNRPQLHRSDAVALYVNSLEESFLPRGRRTFQKWVFWTLETPMESFEDKIKPHNAAFNWTMTYRRDSDIVDGFGSVVRRNESLASASHNAELEKRWRNKSRTVAWYPTACDGAAAEYVRKLKQYISVDVYGKCGNMSCPTTSYGDDDEECYEMLASKYFFVLALETDSCADYVTQPLYRFLRYDVVPVVKGGADYSTVTPPGSVVDVGKYLEPYDVAALMTKAAARFELYRHYLSWKRDYEVLVRNYDNFCGLCDKLYSNEFGQESAHEDVIGWWNNGTKCTSG